MPKEHVIACLFCNTSVDGDSTFFKYCGNTFTQNVNITLVDMDCETPVIVQAEDFIDMANVQTEPTQDVGGGENVGWIDAGDWMVYEINLPCAQTYNMKARVATPNYSMSARVELPNQTLLATLNIPHTGGWQNWSEANVQFDLPEGVNYITIAANTTGFNVNWFEFTKYEGGDNECPLWQPNTNYPIGTVVTYNGNNYTSNNDWNGTAGAPDLANWGWISGGTCIGTKSADGELEMLTQKHDLNLFPNPVTGDVLNIATSSEFSNAKITIYDVYGKVRIQESFDNAFSTISTQDLEDGTYIIKAIIDNDLVLDKLIKARP